ncbi:hypothetical protein Nhal_1278 [Nitrosococcus halophilus Nc 4]|uniref:Uncharacterized protein n=1 Tax=Nitrosococcus halophilus (strain Nc4) TaxID=472759 RepID=D5C0A6_NITHN|nr:hypothetical protein Nhal_1278 [Nitrosococcus halophilus Nc 4]
MITVAETQPYRKKAKKLLSEEERNYLIAYLSEYPASGTIIQGTNDVRKLRWTRNDSGKSGGYRIIYSFHNKYRRQSLQSNIWSRVRHAIMFFRH